MLNFNSAEEVEKFHLQNGLNNSFCVAPFTTLLLEPDGKVGACRHKGSEFEIGNILKQSLNEVWNGSKIQTWRQEFLDGKSNICKTELKDRKCNLCPEYNQLIDLKNLKVIQESKPTRLAFNFNGHCNLECNMCHIWKKPNGLYDKIGFWNEIQNWAPHLKEVELLSGEPFIQKDTYKLIDLISEINPNCSWTITTNANWKLNTYIIQKLDKIKIKNIIVSLDSTIEETYLLIRKKGKLNLALETISDLKNYDITRVNKNKSSLNIKVNFLFQQLNWKELPLVDDFAEKNSLNCFKTFLYEPDELSLLSLEKSKKVEILNYYLNNMTIQKIKKSMRIIKPLVDNIEIIEKVNFLIRLKEKNN